MRFPILLLFCSLSLTQILCQEAWSLDRCLKYAQETNITIQQAQLNLRSAQLDLKGAKAARNPNITAGINGGAQTGRTVDPTTNTFGTAIIGFNSLSLNAGVNLFQGGLIKHSIKQSNHLAQAAQLDTERTYNDVGLLVAQSYLNILLAEEQLQNAQNRIDQSNEQLRTTRKLIMVGTLPAVDSLNVIAQLTRDQQVEIATQNSLDLAYLSLRQLLQLETDKPFKIEDPLIQTPEESYLSSLAMRDIYTNAVATQPAIRAGESRLRAAHEGVSIAKAGLYPTVGFFGQLTSNYSTQFKEFKPTGLGSFGPPSLLLSTTKDILNPAARYDTILAKQFIPDIRGNSVAYNNQISDNFGQGVGLNITVPIYQNGRTNINIQRAKLNIKAVELQNEQARQQLRADIQTAMANAKAANNQYKAAQATYKATLLAHENMKKRNALGAVNTLDLFTTRNNLAQSENDVTLARYDYIFKVKILDFYLGRKITLK
jgi:outer membrane protein